MPIKSIFYFVRGFLVSIGFLLFVGTTSFADDKLSPQDSLAQTILQKADEIRFPSDGFQVDINITSSAPDQDTEKRKYRVLSKGNTNTVVMILEPASERGQIMLMKGHDLWIFMPDVSQPIRLGMAQRLTGQVANGDLARANFSGDYTPRLMGSEIIDGEPYYALDLMAVDRSVTYHRVKLWVNKTNYRPLKAEFYSLSNRLMKTCNYEGYEYAGGTRRPMRLIMEDALQPGVRSVLDYSSLKLRTLPDEVFSKEYLKKLQ